MQYTFRNVFQSVIRKYGQKAGSNVKAHNVNMYALY
jgi:hypothetical protein